MASINLYAPIVSSNTPAFIFTSDVCKVYFSLSVFNSIDEISNVQASVYYQKQGRNAVKIDSLNNSGILVDLKIKETSTKGVYYIEIPKSKIEGTGWGQGLIYKIQLRFVDKIAGFWYSSGSNDQVAWLATNAGHFSEWSTVTITKAIGTKSIKWKNNLLSSSGNKYTSSTLAVVGEFFCYSEDLYSYQLTLYDNNGNLIENGEQIILNSYENKNIINYIFKTEVTTGRYQIIGHFETLNKYEFSENINVEVDVSLGIAPSVKMTLKDNIHNIFEEEGCLGFDIELNELGSEYNALCIRRTSSLSNYEKWEDLKIYQQTDNTTVSFFDFTIESGVYYKYKIEGYNINTKMRSSSIAATYNDLELEPKAVIFEYSFLLGENNQQLKIKFDDNISNYQIKVNDVITETIGSQYPYSIRVGNSYYKTFSISGKISFNMDDRYVFLHKNFINGYAATPDHYNRTYERKFRDEVYKFLNNNKIKLFKSPTEGNILVRLTNNNLSPEAVLGRLISNFSSNAIEIGDNDLSTLNEYKVSKLEVNTSVYENKNLSDNYIVI